MMKTRPTGISLASWPLAALTIACTFNAGGLGEDGSESASSTSEASATTSAGETTSASEPTTSTSAEPTTSSSSGEPTTSSTGPGPSCGDGTIDAGEQCDDGPNNGAGKLCKADCTLNICGDGDVSPSEGCDDGNTVDGDGCSADCMSEGCGDGEVQPPEECDDGNTINDDGCTNACKLPACGDGILQGDEACDNGGMNSDQGACTSGCALASCGDGLVQVGVEECDEGPMNANTGSCTLQCAAAACGDGFVQAGEQCDDGNIMSDDGCSAMCEHEGLRVFVSSSTHNGSLVSGIELGLAAADAICTELAEKAGLDGEWQAWLSDGLSGPATRFTTKGGPKKYIRTDGALIAVNWGALIDGNLDAAIDRDENGTNPGNPAHVWTNTKTDGTVNSGVDNCAGWTIGVNGPKGRRGNRGQTGPKWTEDGTDNCGAQRRLYCFEQ